MPLPSLSTVEIIQLLLVATVAIGVSGGLLAWRERPEPGAIALAVLMAGQCWWSVTLFFRIGATGIDGKVFWASVGWLGVVVIPVAWLLFSLEYTGYTQYVTPRYIVALSVVPALTALLSLTNGYHHLLYVDSTLVEVSGALTLDRIPGVWFWVIAGYTYLLGLAGAVPMLQFVTSDLGVFRWQSLAILVGLFVPWTTNALFLLGALPTAGIDPTPIGFSISGVAYLCALTRFRLFGTNPTPIRQARRSVFRRIQEGAIVLDSHDHVVDMNERAWELLDADPDDALGRPIAEVVPDFDRAIENQSESGGTVFYPESNDRAYDLSVSELVDTHDRRIGRIITLHDISDHLRQQQRLEVLNRVFRHNIRTNIQIILGHVDYLATNNSEQKAEIARRNALDIEEISGKIRTILDLFEQWRYPTESVRLGALLRENAAAVRNEYPAVSIHCDLDGSDVYVDLLLDDVLSNVIENAAQHNTNPDPQVWIDVETHDEYARIVVEDNGPGIDDEELALLEHGTETPLEHGSGFGLALIMWGTEITGGDVTFEESDSGGLTVTIDVPTVSGSGWDGETNRRVERSGPGPDPVSTW